MLPEEEIASLIETRSALLGMIAHHESGHPVIRKTLGKQVNDPDTDLADLKGKLAQVEGYLAEAGLSFDA